MSATADRILYWMHNPLSKTELRFLRRAIKESFFPPPTDSHIAYLIALECLSWDDDTWKVSITEKGEDALDFHNS